ncbi:tetratricopeptide repeat protein [Chitinimonas sp. BJYL2]|uniref:tetratricopeptide repeat protein n=1 Tax=Chitinimonas sp. BJYL2 TaxID=2976696 RepID=UPI0022B463A7|nr:tetratricopeptide repeat protein [Chitinimonas sp. BJYL2]
MPPASSSPAHADPLDRRKPLPRQRLFPPQSVIALAASAAAALFLIFPKGRELSEIAAQARTDALSLQYLRNLVRASPRDVELNLLLANQELALGNVQVARQMAYGLRDLGDTTLTQEAEHILLMSALYERDRQQPDAQRLRVLQAEIDDLVLRMIDHGPLTPDTLNLLMPELNRHRRGGALIDTLRLRLLRSNTLAPDILLRIAGQALAHGHHRAAADFTLMAAKGSRQRAEQRDLLLQGLRHLQAGSLFREAGEVLANPPVSPGDDPRLLGELARIALAVGRPDLAQRYVEQALRLSLAPRWSTAWQLAQGRGDEFGGRWLPVSNELLQAPIEGRTAGLPFDEGLYQLGYDIFLANGKLNDAYLLARAGVQARPASAAWHRRLAQVARWLSRPDESLNHWLSAARLGDVAAWKDVEELVPSIQDENLRVSTLEQLVRAGLGGDARLDELVLAYDAAGRPEAAVQLIESLYRERRESKLLIRLADFHHHIGDRDREAEVVRRQIRDFGLDEVSALRLSRILIAERREAEALVMLEQAAERLPTLSVPTWRLMAQLADMLQRPDAARAAYRRLVDTPEATQSDLRVYYSLTWREDPDSAYRAATLAWERFADSTMFLASLEIDIARERWPALRERLDTLKPGQLAMLRKQARYLAMSAQIRHQSSQPELALTDYREAIALAPRDTSLRVGMLWLLLDMGTQRQLLRQYVHAWHGDGAQGGPLTHVLGTAYLQLEEPAQALALLQIEWRRMRRAGERPSQSWQETYADALEQAGQPALAYNLRRTLWQKTISAIRNDPARFQKAPQALVDAARLALRQQRGDGLTQVMQQLLRQSTHPLHDNPIRAQLLGAWLQLRDQPAAARRYLLGRQMARLANPAYLALGVAVANGDTEAVSRLLADAENLPVKDRILAADLLRDNDKAKLWAAGGLAGRRHDDDLHGMMTERFFKDAGRLALSQARQSRGPLDLDVREFNATVPLAGRGALMLKHAHQRQTVVRPRSLGEVPRTSEYHEIGWEQGSEALDGWIALGRLRGFDGHGGHRLGLRWRPDGHHQVQWRQEAGQPTSDSTLLQLAGQRGGNALGWNWQIGRREYLMAEQGDWTYRTQDGGRLGQSRLGSVELGYRVRLDTPNITVRAGYNQYDFRADGELAPRYLKLIPDAEAAYAEIGNTRPWLNDFLPPSSRQWSVGLNYNDASPSQYRRRWTPYGQVTLARNSVSGKGHEVRLGIGGSLLGALPDGVDRLNLEWVQSQGSSPAGNRDRSSSLSVVWQYWFDKPSSSRD